MIPKDIAGCHVLCVFDFNDVSYVTLATQELVIVEDASTQGLFRRTDLTLFFPVETLLWT